jgi:hypothetical protein
LSQAELSKARNLIVQYQNSIADLGSQIAALTKQNQELMAANGQLNTDLSLERSIAVKLTEQNKGLAKKVELGLFAAACQNGCRKLSAIETTVRKCMLSALRLPKV